MPPPAHAGGRQRIAEARRGAEHQTLPGRRRATAGRGRTSSSAPCGSTTCASQPAAPPPSAPHATSASARSERARASAAASPAPTPAPPTAPATAPTSARAIDDTRRRERSGQQQQRKAAERAAGHAGDAHRPSPPSPIGETRHATRAAGAGDTTATAERSQPAPPASGTSPAPGTSHRASRRMARARPCPGLASSRRKRLDGAERVELFRGVAPILIRARADPAGADQRVERSAVGGAAASPPRRLATCRDAPRACVAFGCTGAWPHACWRARRSGRRGRTDTVPRHRADEHAARADRRRARAAACECAWLSAPSDTITSAHTRSKISWRCTAASRRSINSRSRSK